MSGYERRTPSNPAGAPPTWPTYGASTLLEMVTNDIVNLKTTSVLRSARICNKTPTRKNVSISEFQNFELFPEPLSQRRDEFRTK